MHVTEAAVNAILHVMEKRQLDPRKTVFEIILLSNGAVGIGFNRDRSGVAYNYGPLTVMVGHGVDMSRTVVDYGQIDGRQGIIFLSEEKYVNHNH